MMRNHPQIANMSSGTTLINSLLCRDVVSLKLIALSININVHEYWVRRGKCYFGINALWFYKITNNSQTA